jgi:hypothetical protein
MAGDLATDQRLPRLATTERIAAVGSLEHLSVALVEVVPVAEPAARVVASPRNGVADALENHSR